MIKKIDYQMFQDEVKKADKALIKFGAEWCGHCKNMAPTIKELSNEYPDIPFYEVDSDEQMDICRELKVMSLPTFIIMKNGEEVKKLIGEQPKELLEEALNL